MSRFTHLLAREWREDLRDREGLPVLALFALVLVVMLRFALDPGGRGLLAVGAALPALVVALGAPLLLAAAAAREDRRGTTLYLLAAPLDLSELFLARLLVRSMWLILAALLAMALGALFLNAGWSAAALPAALLAVVLGCVGAAALGLLLSALLGGGGTAPRLGVVLLPFMVPLVIGLSSSLYLLREGADWFEVAGWMRLLGAFAAAPTLLGVFAYPRALRG